MAKLAWLLLLCLVALPAGAQESVTSLLNAQPNVATGGTSEETLYAVAIPAGAFDRVGTQVRIQAVASTTSNANTKTLRLRDTGTLGSITCAVNATTNCVLDVTLVRTNGNSYVPYGTAWSGSGAIAAASGSSSVTPRDFSGALTVLVQGTTAQAGDLVLRSVVVTLTRAITLAALAIQQIGADMRVTSAYQQWTLRQFASAHGAGDWVLVDERIKATNNAWVPAFTNPGMNNTVAYRNGTFLGGSHLGMGTPVAVWTMDGIPFTPGTAPKSGSVLVLDQSVTGYVSGVPTLSARFITTWQGETTTHQIHYEALAASTATTTEYLAMSDVLLCGGAFTSVTVGGTPTAGPADCGVWTQPPHYTTPQDSTNYVLSGPYGSMTVTLGGTRTCFVRLQDSLYAKVYAYWNTGTRAIGDVDDVTYTRTFVPAP